MKKAGIIIFIVIIQFYLLPYRALYIYSTANKVSFSEINAESKNNKPLQGIEKFSNNFGTSIGKNIPPKHNDRFADILTTLPVFNTYNTYQLVILQELLPSKHLDSYFAPLILPNSSRGSPLA